MVQPQLCCWQLCLRHTPSCQAAAGSQPHSLGDLLMWQQVAELNVVHVQVDFKKPTECGAASECALQAPGQMCQVYSKQACGFCCSPESATQLGAVQQIQLPAAKPALDYIQVHMPTCCRGVEHARACLLQAIQADMS